MELDCGLSMRQWAREKRSHHSRSWRGPIRDNCRTIYPKSLTYISLITYLLLDKIPFHVPDPVLHTIVIMKFDNAEHEHRVSLFVHSSLNSRIKPNEISNWLVWSVSRIVPCGVPFGFIFVKSASGPSRYNVSSTGLEYRNPPSNCGPAVGC